MNLLVNSQSDACICSGCHGGKKLIAFDLTGSIYPCDLTDYPEEKIGNVSDNGNLVQTIEDAIKKRPFFVPKKTAECASCPWKCYCKGGCTVNIKSLGLPKGAIDPIECAVNKTLYPKLINFILQKPKEVNSFIGRDIL